MNKPFTRGQKARNMPISRDNAGDQAVDAPPMPYVVARSAHVEVVVTTCFAALGAAAEHEEEERDEEGRP